MRFGLDVPVDGSFADPKLLATLAGEAEATGWDGFFLQEVPVLDAFVTLAAAAVTTRRIKLGAFMTPLARRRPWQLAREVVTLDHLSDGRVIFGAGLGHEPSEFAAIGEEPNPRVRATELDEGLLLLDAIWRGQAVHFEGRHYRYHLDAAPIRPVQQPRVPIWTAAGWPRRRPLRRAANWDGVYLMTVHQQTRRLLTPQDVSQVRASVRAERSSSAPFDIAINGEVPDGVDPESYIDAFEEAGATWWVWVALFEATPDDYRRRIRQGPPRAPAA